MFEASTGQEFRFTPEGPSVDRGRVAGIASRCCRWSTPTTSSRAAASRAGCPRLLRPGGPPGEGAGQPGDRRQLGGRAFAGALAEGVFLVKPSRRELTGLIGRDARTPADEEALAREVVDGGKAEVVALTLGAAGAVLATRDQTPPARQPAGRGGERRGRG